MTKFVPHLTNTKVYELSLVAINQVGPRCDLIYRYTDDDGDEMFIREFTDNYFERVTRLAVDPNGNTTDFVKDVVTRGCHKRFGSVYRLCVIAELGLNYNPATGHWYTAITQTHGLSTNYTHAETEPTWWLQNEHYYGDSQLRLLDKQYNANYYDAVTELEERVNAYESECWVLAADSAEVATV